MIMLVVSHHPKPPGHPPPNEDGLRPTHFWAGEHHGGTPPHSRQGSPEVSPRTPFPSPSRPGPRLPHPPPGTRRQPRLGFATLCHDNITEEMV
jgi:hypothetical protein